MSCPDTDYNGTDRRNRCDHADEAAERAVKKMFKIMGVDTNDPRQIKEFQENLWFSGKLRKMADKGLVGILTTAITLIVGTIWYALTKQQ